MDYLDPERVNELLQQLNTTRDDVGQRFNDKMTANEMIAFAMNILELLYVVGNSARDTPEPIGFVSFSGPRDSTE